MIWGKKEKALYYQVNELSFAVSKIDSILGALLEYHSLVGGTISCGTTIREPCATGYPCAGCGCEISKSEVT